MQSSGKKVRDTGKKVRDTFFKLVEGTGDVWVCRCGTKRKVKGSGYTNFATHVQSQHPAEHRISLLLPPASRNRLTHYFIQKKLFRFMGGCNLLFIACNRFRLWKTQSVPSTL